MRSRMNYTITSCQVYSWALTSLLQVKLVKDHGWLCTARVVLSIVLRAAGRSISVSAACRDLANGPSDQAVMTALEEGLPRTLPVLEGRLNDALTDPLPPRMRRRSWELAIDWHLQPYYGQPDKSRNEIYYGKPRQGTKKFHAYASACIVEYGHRYTVALTWVRRHESMVAVLRRLLARTREIGLKIKCVLLDRAFFNVPVVEFLQAENLPFLMPVVMRGRTPKKGRKPTGLRWIKRQPAGWYPHTMKNKKRQVDVSICVGYRCHRNRQDRRRSAPEVALRRLAGVRFSHRHPRALSPPVWHRNQLSANAPGPHLYLHAQSSSPACLPGLGPDPAQPLGLDSSDTPGRRIRRQPDAASGKTALQTNARLDRSRGRHPISRWLNALHRMVVIERTWNYCHSTFSNQ